MSTAPIPIERQDPKRRKHTALGARGDHWSLAELRPEAAWEPARELTVGREGIRRGRIEYRIGQDLLFGVLAVDEREGRRTPSATALQTVTEAAYGELFATIEAAGFPYLVRVWNYLPRINGIEEGVERYRRFNIARQEAFANADRPLTGKVPAACALGSRGGPLTIGFLAARRPARSLENPRQVSAFHYPPDYGSRSPTFARAVLLEDAREPLLFISGTAAIVGHRSLHPGDVLAQTRETITNLETMIAAANQALGRPRISPDALDYVVYVRLGKDCATVAAAMDRWLGGTARCRFMEADICRRELLVEIEANVRPATIRCPATPHT